MHAKVRVAGSVGSAAHTPRRVLRRCAGSAPRGRELPCERVPKFAKEKRGITSLQVVPEWNALVAVVGQSRDGGFRVKARLPPPTTLCVVDPQMARCSCLA